MIRAFLVYELPPCAGGGCATFRRLQAQLAHFPAIGSEIDADSDGGLAGLPLTVTRWRQRALNSADPHSGALLVFVEVRRRPYETIPEHYWADHGWSEPTHWGGF